jgi:gluconokinase
LQLKFVIMGVAGSGKSTVGALLAKRLGVPFADGDEFHPQANRDKMAAGTPLTDDDRWPWLDAIAAWLDSHERCVVACSALRRAYRDRLRRAGVVFVYLEGSRDALAARLAARRDHFFPPELLDSQLALLEEPTEDEHAISCSIEQTPEEIVEIVEMIA